MPTEKIDAIPEACKHSDHKPSTKTQYEEGRYKHTCPECSHVIFFSVTRPEWAYSKNRDNKIIWYEQ